MNNLSHARVRLEYILQRPNQQQIRQAREWLESWVRAYGPEADFPWVWTFSDEAGCVEFEFHQPHRRLVLHCLTAKVEYSAWSDEDAAETEHEGVCLPKKVVPMIEWVTGKRQEWPEML